MGTFADLMSLLMCFFVLLLSFAEMDAMKFKRLAGSMAQAFGVQNKMKLKDPPKGTSIIALEFSPGRPEPTPINEIYQKTENVLTKLSLDVQCAEEYDVQAGEENIDAGAQVQIEDAKAAIDKLIKETEQDATELAKSLSKQIASGEVEIETHGRKIIVRIREQGSFRSGSAELAPDYIPLLREVRDVLSTKPGTISVQGHTDNIPIKTARFRSNWDLSSARAVSVAQELFRDGVISPNRFQVSGFAETRPLASNDTSDGRAKNRRVEIVVEQGLGKELVEDIKVLKDIEPEFLESLQLEDEDFFDLRPNEIF
jgi:chemotaxis protein MotB